MIKSLQKRFVIVAMSAVTLLLVILIGVLNITNVIITERQTDRLLEFLLHSETVVRREPLHRKPNGGFMAEPFDEDTRMSSVHFAATVGETIKVDVRRIATVDEESALKYVEKAVAAGKTDGKIDRFRYRAAVRENDTVYVFLDTSSQNYSIARIAGISLLAGIGTFFMMLALVMLMSKKAIRPIAQNIEKQKQFVTDAGHELKTPIAIILANTEALELHNGESKWSKNIREQTARLTSLTQNLLALSRAEETEKRTATEFSLSKLVSDGADAFREPMEQRTLKLYCDIDKEVTLVADKEQTARVLSILLDNALRYAKSDSEVELILRSTVLSISNECENLPDCLPEKLFDRFYRGDMSRNSEGYGIGLSAAAALVDGRITAEYIGVNKIKFTVKFT